MNLLINIYLPLTMILVVTSWSLHLLPRLGKVGKVLEESFCYAPAIDLLLVYFMILPLIYGSFIASWIGTGIALTAQLSSLWIWVISHELMHYKNRHQLKIFPTLSNIVGAWRNHLAVWITTLAIPLFWTVRLTQIIVYPPLTWLVGLPKYQTKDWVNVSRQKFEGLIGYDLIWCLYCDWMTGVWSLGTEMLRNVESFWCPIRFYSNKKCDNCQIDFPDLQQGWVAADGTMEDVTQLLKCKYATQKERSWFGHSSRFSE